MKHCLFKVIKFHIIILKVIGDQKYNYNVVWQGEKTQAWGMEIRQNVNLSSDEVMKHKVEER